MVLGAEAVETALKGRCASGAYDKKGISTRTPDVLALPPFPASSASQVRIPASGSFVTPLRSSPAATSEAVNIHSTNAPPSWARSGRGGVVIPARSFLKGLRDLADQVRIMLVADERSVGAYVHRKLRCLHLRASAPTTA